MIERSIPEAQIAVCPMGKRAITERRRNITRNIEVHIQRKSTSTANQLHLILNSKTDMFLRNLMEHMKMMPRCSWNTAIDGLSVLFR